MSLHHWTFPCPHAYPCSYSIDVAVDSGTGEEAAALMDEHMQRAHGERFPAGLALAAATKGTNDA